MPPCTGREAAMKCVVCKQGETEPGKATLTLERNGVTLIVKGIPAQVCRNCREEYVDEHAAKEVLRMAEEAARSGVQLEIRTYAAA